MNCVHRALKPPDMPRHPVRMDGHVHDPRMHGDEVVGAEGLRHHCRVRTKASLHQVVRALAALRLARHAGHHEIARQAHAGSPDGLGRHDDAGQTSLHVLHPVAVEPIAFEAGHPRIAPPAQGERVDVGVAVEHQAGATARATQDGNRLKSPGLDLLKVDVVAALAEELLEKERDRSLFRLEARDTDESTGEVDQLPPVDVREYRAGQVSHWARRRRENPPQARFVLKNMIVRSQASLAAASL